MEKRKKKEHSYFCVIKMKAFDCQPALQKKIEEIYVIFTSKRPISQWYKIVVSGVRDESAWGWPFWDLSPCSWAVQTAS